jgi:hypothetical protein
MQYLPKMAIAGTFFAALGFSQTFAVPDPSNWQSKLRFHALNAYGPGAIAKSFAYAGFFQVTNAPREWGQGDLAYGERLGSMLAYYGVRNVIGFGLDTALHQDPRYYRSGKTAFWPRVGHVFRATVLTRTDSGGEAFAAWRLGSAYGAAFLSNEWQPGRLNNVHAGMTQGTTQLGFDVVTNLGSEFWPDIKKTFLRRNP